MNQNQIQYFVPVLTSEAGACLTLANWQEAGVQVLAYNLDAWLMKPGYALLSALQSVRSYSGWQGTIVLNATLAAANAEGIYKLRSRYDGSQLQISQEELAALINQLQPDIVILPPGLARYLEEQKFSFAKTITAFIPVDEYKKSDYPGQAGVYLSYQKTRPFGEFIAALKQNSGMQIYVSGDFDLSQAQELIKEGVNWLESDKPASDALQGLLYAEESSLALLDQERAQEHKLIHAHCSCPTCIQKLTRAYLHHLFVQTPLLCQRFLILHNVHNYIQNMKTLQESL